MARRSRIKRLYSRKLARRLASARGTTKDELEKFAAREADDAITRMRHKGWKLITQLDTGEGVFVRDEELIGLHIQVPSALYKKLDQECKRRETTKRQLVTVAIEQYLERST